MATKTAAPVKVGEKHSADYRAYADAKYGWQTAADIPVEFYIFGAIGVAGLAILFVIWRS